MYWYVVKVPDLGWGLALFGSSLSCNIPTGNDCAMPLIFNHQPGAGDWDELRVDGGLCEGDSSGGSGSGDSSSGEPP
jgi:hypothetical protein